MSADSVFWWANWVLIGALVVGLLATYAIVVSGNLKEAALRRELGEAAATAETAKANAAATTERAAALENEAAQARLEQERLKAVVAWRVLPPTALARLTAELSSEPKGSVTLAYTGNDSEALFLAIQISKALEGAHGWNVSGQARTYPDRILFGLYLPGSGHLVDHLREAFRAAGIDFSTDNVPMPAMAFAQQSPATPDTALIFVGSKRPPF